MGSVKAPGMASLVYSSINFGTLWVGDEGSQMILLFERVVLSKDPNHIQIASIPEVRTQKPYSSIDQPVCEFVYKMISKTLSSRFKYF